MAQKGFDLVSRLGTVPTKDECIRELIELGCPPDQAPDVADDAIKRLKQIQDQLIQADSRIRPLMQACIKDMLALPPEERALYLLDTANAIVSYHMELLAHSGADVAEDAGKFAQVISKVFSMLAFTLGVLHEEETKRVIAGRGDKNADDGFRFSFPEGYKPAESKGPWASKSPLPPPPPPPSMPQARLSGEPKTGFYL